MERLEYKKGRKLSNMILAADLVATLRDLKFAVTSTENLMTNYVTTTKEGIREFMKEQYGDESRRVIISDTANAKFPFTFGGLSYAKDKREVFCVESLVERGDFGIDAVINIYSTVSQTSHTVTVNEKSPMVDGLVYLGRKSQPVLLVNLLRCSIRESELPAHCGPFRSDFCFCDHKTRHMCWSRSTFSGKWIECTECKLWCHNECAPKYAASRKKFLCNFCNSAE